MDKDERLKNKKSIILIIIVTIVIGSMIIGATYAYFQAQSATAESSRVNVITGTTDNLRFSLEDLDVNKKNVVVKDEENILKDIMITANTDNFAPEATSLGDGVKGTIELLANDASNEAHEDYYVYLRIDTNELRYTAYKDENGDLLEGIEQDGEIIAPDETHTIKVPELILTIKKTDKTTGETTEITGGLEGLDYLTNVTNTEENQINGFDITGKEGLIMIKKDTIETNDNKKNPDASSQINKTTYEWEVIITLINLETDQKLNAGSNFAGELIIQQDEYIDIDVEPSATSKTITLNVNVRNWDGNEVTYMYSINKGQSWEEASSNEGSHTFVINSLPSNTPIEVWVKIVDNQGKSSPIYKNTITTDFASPEIESINLEKIDNTMKVNIKGQKGTDEIATYYLSIDGDSWQEIASNSLDVSYTYDSIPEGSFDIYAYVKDIKDRQSDEVVKTAKLITVEFAANNNEISKTSEGCFLIDDASTCNITTPKITAPEATPNIIGFSIAADNYEKTFGSEEEVAISTANADQTYYAQTYQDEVVYNVNYVKGSNTTAIGAESDSCTIEKAYNGAPQETTCPVIAPSITASGDYVSIGWALRSGASGIAAGKEITLTEDGLTYYGNSARGISISTNHYGWDKSQGNQCVSPNLSHVYEFNISVASGTSLSSGHLCLHTSSKDYCGYYSSNSNTGGGYACFYGTQWKFFRSSSTAQVYAYACSSASKCTTAKINY